MFSCFLLLTSTAVKNVSVAWISSSVYNSYVLWDVSTKETVTHMKLNCKNLKQGKLIITTFET